MAELRQAIIDMELLISLKNITPTIKEKEDAPPLKLNGQNPRILVVCVTVLVIACVYVCVRRRRNRIQKCGIWVRALCCLS